VREIEVQFYSAEVSASSKCDERAEAGDEFCTEYEMQKFRKYNDRARFVRLNPITFFWQSIPHVSQNSLAHLALCHNRYANVK
jgi:hypothetical protein